MKGEMFEALCLLIRGGGSLEEIQSLIKKGVDINGKDSDGNTPLLLAAQNDRRETVNLLIRCGADIHCSADDNWTVLHCASAAGWKDTVQYLLEKNCDWNRKASYGFTPLMLAAHFREKEIVDLLLRSVHCRWKENWYVLHCAILENWKDTVQYLLKNKCDLNRKESTEGKTPLFLAAECGSIEIVQFLLKEGADIHAIDDEENTVLHAAVKNLNRKNIVGLLLRGGANWNVENIEGESPFCLLLQREDIAGIGEFIEMGSYVESFAYEKLLEQPFFRDVFLKDIKLCSMSIINKHNRKDLPALYAMAAMRLPPIHQMQIGKDSEMAAVVEQAVAREIQTTGYCKVLEALPLSMLCVKSFINYINNVEQSRGANDL